MGVLTKDEVTFVPLAQASGMGVKIKTVYGFYNCYLSVGTTHWSHQMRMLGQGNYTLP